MASCQPKDVLEMGARSPATLGTRPPCRPPPSPAPTLGVLDDVLQQQRVLGQALHFGDDQVLELQAPALRIAFCFLGWKGEG